ncbi:hypothetical protein VUR80DRAFT_6425 [Thermomyces stellatus]
MGGVDVARLILVLSSLSWPLATCYGNPVIPTSATGSVIQNVSLGPQYPVRDFTHKTQRLPQRLGPRDKINARIRRRPTGSNTHVMIYTPTHNGRNYLDSIMSRYLSLGPLWVTRNDLFCRPDRKITKAPLQPFFLTTGAIVPTFSVRAWKKNNKGKPTNKET